MWRDGILQLRLADDAGILSDLIIDAALLVDQKRAQEFCVIQCFCSSQVNQRCDTAAAARFFLTLGLLGFARLTL